MTIEQIIRVFFKKIYSFKDALNDDIELSCDEDNLETVTQHIINNLDLSNQEKFILNILNNFLISGYNLNEVFTNYITFNKVEIKHLKRNKKTKFRIREFASTSSNGAIIPVRYFTEDNIYNLSHGDKDEINKIIIEIVFHYSDKPQNEFNKFFSTIINQIKNAVISTFNNSIDFIDLYSKCYYVYLLKGYSTRLPNELLYNYSLNTSILTDVYLSNGIFTQFFEIFDVIDEYHHSSDILIKYLKMYQIIEYLITRTVIVNIQSNQTNRNLFLREISSLSKLDDYDEKKAKLLFDNDKAVLTTWFANILNSNQRIKGAVEYLLTLSNPIQTGNNNEIFNSLLRVIYKLRNAIVHNKESEVHLTVHNLEQTEGVLLLIKELLKKFEQILFKKITSFEDTIKYEKPYLELY